VDSSEAFRTLQAVLDAGVQVLDTSDAYAAGENEMLVGRAVADRRDFACIVTKFGWVLDSAGRAVKLDSSPGRVRSACEASLIRLRTDYIDVYVQHRIDPQVPIEETVGELLKLEAEGKIRAFGLSEVAPTTLKRAHALAPVEVLQTEYSLWSREPEVELLPVCAELGVTFMAYSPLGRGFLAGAIRSVKDLAQGDLRRTHPRFDAPNIDQNMAFMRVISHLAEAHGCTTPQLALAWIVAQPWRIIPIPSTRTIDHFEENLKALDVRLSTADLERIAAAVPATMIHGMRHPAEHMKTLNR
jgi:aryl-alcohol dehydrogenase-like predicted oxidoreductase